ncbi:hypothetical protein PNA2_1063 [Pyrococcus sp. NA2]|uniref:glycosyltransferase family 4 protein n=1 Tax=Pyrococcus sp. (strain NA2) TaxID=342949 RepID=UPI000209AA79|nr:glycosyltransferase family 4 protein [Pyrococcus sp. NA2]AEC51979.1 hypothetical protein PNA2_1063 [Pyrococcus sp. NA2]
MKVLMIGHYPPHRGGVARHVKALVECLAEHEVHVITYGTVKGREEGVSYVRVPNVFGLRGISFTLLASRLAVKLHRKFNFDLIHAHYVGTTSYAGVLAKERTGLPLVITAHGSDLNFLSKLPLGNYYVRESLKKADLVIAVSHDLAKKAMKLGANKVKVIPNFVTMKGESRRNVIAFIGRVSSYKGVDDFVRLAEFFPEERFIVVGEGPILEKLRGEAPGNVSFLGYRRSEEVLREAKVLVLPSRREGFGLVILEANSFGVPALGRKVGGITELIREGKNGYLFTNLEEAVEHLRKLLIPKVNLKKGFIGKRVVELYDRERICREIVKAYEEVVS